MAAVLSSKMAGPPRKKTKPTQTEKHHRYESFTKRVARLKIDPVHTVQHSRIVETDNGLSQSYFRSALDEWAELNLTTTFTSFLNKITALSESLPQLLHHADQIVDILLEHIQRQDALAQEAFMSLTAHLAHDLGPAFEKYFERIVRAVVHTATVQEDPVVIESCFTCSAWMYKYLSRLLVRDLRPLLDILFPYFVSKREYIRRFTAESLAFLLRKAAALYQKDRKPLLTALRHIFVRLRDTQSGREASAFQDAIMTLLVETMIGVDAGVHSSAPSLLACACEVATTDEGADSRALRTVEGIVVNLIHKTNAAGFEPLLKVITDFNTREIVREALTEYDLRVASLQTRLLLVVSAVRNGTRVSEWSKLVDILIQHITIESSSYQATMTKKAISRTASAIIQNAPLSTLLPCIRRLIDSLAGFLLPPQFFSFCETIARLQTSRFQDLVLPNLQEYIIKHFLDPELENLALLFTELHGIECVHRHASKQGYTFLLPELESKLQSLNAEKSSDRHMLHFLTGLLLSRSIHYPKRREFGTDQVEELLKALNDPSQTSPLSTRLELGWILESIVEGGAIRSLTHQCDLQAFFSLPEERYKILPVLHALTLLVESADNTLPSLFKELDATRHLANNMLNTSKDIRKQSLILLRALYSRAGTPSQRDVCDYLIEILDVEYNIANVRQLSMMIRRLPQRQRDLSDNGSTQDLIPYFCLSLLSDYHDTLRKDVCLALAEIVEEARLEESVLEVVKEWLIAPNPTSTSTSNEDQGAATGHIPEFACNRMQAIESLEEESEKHYEQPEQKVRDVVERAHVVHNVLIPSEGRQIALQVLLEIPHIAERRSKILVPAFLTAYSGCSNQAALQDESGSTNTLSPDIDGVMWTLKERKMFLELLSKFNNPRMLYRSDDVHQILLELLSNGDPGVRTMAVQAVMKWKDKALTTYAQALIQVAEDKKTTTELALLFSHDEESSVVKRDDRSHVVPVLLRLVFGQLIGRGGGHGSQEAKRKSLLRIVFRLSQPEVEMFLAVVLGRLQSINLPMFENVESCLLTSIHMSLDQQYGFLRMVLSMLNVLQTQFAPYGSTMVPAILYCTARAAHQINSLNASEAAPALMRNIRRTGIQCLTDLFRFCDNVSWAAFMPVIYETMIKPRLRDFVIENAQSVSGLLHLFAAWSHKKPGLDCLRYDSDSIVSVTLNLLGSSTTKSDVKIFILQEIVSVLLDESERVHDDGTAFRDFLDAQSTSILAAIANVLSQSPSKPSLLLITQILHKMSSHVADRHISMKIVSLLAQILDEPNQRIPPHIKGSMLRAIESIGSRSEVFQQQDVRQKFFHQLSTCFDYFKDATNRDTCSRLLHQLAQYDQDLAEIARTCLDMNAFSSTSLDDIDYDRRSAAFGKIHHFLETGVSMDQLDRFSPVVYNLLFFVRSSDDTSIRGNALSCLKHLISSIDDTSELSRRLQRIVFEATRKYIKDDSELVRADFVEALGTMVKHWKSWEQLQNMTPLLVGDDEEASFFTNILHIQQHRRTRAMRRLTIEVEKGSITADNISDIFLPLLQKYAQDASGEESVLTIKGQATASMLILFQWLEWKSFRRIFRQYRQGLEQHLEDGKIDVRLLSHAADALNTAVEHKARNNGTIMPHLAASLPGPEIIAGELRTRFIPKLAELSHYKDEGEATERIPAAVVAIKLIKILPEQELALTATPIVLDIAQILRSRTQETRDLARKKLADIVVMLGPSSVQFVLKELRTALTRGYQLHVLSYTLHTILLATAERRQVGDLDYCIQDLVKVIMDDTFGTVGQEKDNQDYVSSMKEVKSNKSFDSMEILAKSTSIKHMFKLLAPFESLLTGSLTTRQTRHVDELLRRIGVGLAHNPGAETQDVLVFAFELIDSFYKAKPARAPRPQTLSEHNRRRFLIQKDSARETHSASVASLLYKLPKFAIDVARSTFARHSSLLNASNVHGFIPVIGDALIEGQEDVKISALRLLSTVIKIHLPELEENVELYVMEAVKVVKNSTNTDEEAAQAALKLVTAALREKHSSNVRDSDIAYLLKRTMPDLEEPDKQGVTFNFIKAVMARRMQLPEIYDLVDKIGLMMITSHSRASRDAARGVYVHFLLDYPQSKIRWSKQIKFLVKNLEYQHPEGRTSVMEATNALVSKIDQSTAKDLAGIMFIPLVLCMANDESAQCREMAGALLAQFFVRIPTSTHLNMLEPLRVWLEQRENATLRKISLQAWAIYFQASQSPDQNLIETVLPHVQEILRDYELNSEDWEITYLALSLMSVLTKTFPEELLSSKQSDPWTSAITLLGTTHPWLQSSTSTLLGLYFEACIAASCISVPLTCEYSLSLDTEAVVWIVRSCTRILRRSETNVDLADIVLRNLLYLLRCAEKSSIRMQLKLSARTDEVHAAQSDESDSEPHQTIETTGETNTSILVTQYILDQAAYCLRREPPKQTSRNLQPKLSFLNLTSALLPHISVHSTASLTQLLVPLLHYTNPSTVTPRSSDSDFDAKWQELVEHAQLCLDAIESAVGERQYPTLVGEATRLARGKRQERKTKRALEVINDPEGAAREKRRKFEQKKRRDKEVKGIHKANRRRGMGM